MRRLRLNRRRRFGHLLATCEKKRIGVNREGRTAGVPSPKTSSSKIVLLDEADETGEAAGCGVVDAFDEDDDESKIPKSQLAALCPDECETPPCCCWWCGCGWARGCC